MTTRTLDLDTLVLAVGAHSATKDDMCVMEAVAFIAGEPWSDHPDCASPVIGAFLRTWNDSLPDADRQTLKQYIPRLVGSKGTTAQEERRAWMALDWLVRVHTPAWLRLAGLVDQANLLAGLAEVDAGTCPSIKPMLEAVRMDAAAAGGVVRDAAWAVARDAAGDAARDAAWAVAGDAAGDAARDAAGAVAGDAAGAVARDAARDALAPTVTELQTSAHDLIDRMLAVTETA